MREAKLQDADEGMLPHYGGLKSDKTVVIHALFYPDIEQILASED